MSLYRSFLGAGSAFVAILCVIVAWTSVTSIALANDVTYLYPATRRSMEYVVSIRPEDQAAIRYVQLALSTIALVPPEDFRVQRSESRRFDFMIDVTTSDRVLAEMKSLGPAMAGASALSYTTYDPETRRYVVRLLWDRISGLKSAHGEVSIHPRTQTRMLTALAREIYGSMRTLSKTSTYRFHGASDPSGRRDSYRESAKTLSRIIAHPTFPRLQEQKQNHIQDAADEEFREADVWESIIEGHRRNDKTKPEASILQFPARCEVMFRENL